MIIQEFYSNMHGFDSSVPSFITHVRGTHIVFTPELIIEVLHVLRVLHPDYPECPHLRTVSKDELLYLFCETPSSWGDRQNISCLGFAKGPRFLDMVMRFVLHPFSHYNSITEPCACFLLSFIEDLTIDFLSHFILSFIDVYKDMLTRDKLIFPSTIMRIIRHSSVSYPESAHFTIIGAIRTASVRWSKAQLRSKWPWTEIMTLLAHSVPSTSIPSSSSSSGVMLEAVTTQLKRMDAHLDTLTIELYQVNTRVSYITQRQARMGGFAASPSLEALEDEDDDDGFGGDDDEDVDASSSGDEEMTASQLLAICYS